MFLTKIINFKSQDTDKFKKFSYNCNSITKQSKISNEVKLQQKHKIQRKYKNVYLTSRSEKEYLISVQNMQRTKNEIY